MTLFGVLIGGLLEAAALAASSRQPAAIIGGEPAITPRLSAVVGLVYKDQTVAHCSGMLVEKDIVLTAAHCLCPQRPVHVFVGSDMETGFGHYYPARGDRYWRAALSCGLQAPQNGVDIAVLQLARPIEAVPLLRFASDKQVDQARSYQIVGFGSEDADGVTLRGRKMEASVSPVSVDCPAMARERYGCQEGEELVAGRNGGGTDTCRGDSGGPLLLDGPVRDKEGNPEPLIAGITSRPTAEDGALCGRGGIYERLRPRVRNWIKDAIGALRAQQ